MRYRNIPLFVLSVMCSLRAVHAQVPRLLSYQGVLSDTSGTPRPDGAYAMAFRLYMTSSGGTPIWSESRTLQARRGLFSTLLGDVTPFADSVRFNRPYWLSLQIGSDPELAPRTPLTSVAYSLSADTARVAGSVPDNAITGAMIGNGQVVKSLNGLKDVITLRAQGGATITSSNDTITINSGAGGGGTGIQGIQNTTNTLDITNPGGPTATVNVKVPLSLSGNVNGNSALSVSNTSTDGHAIYGSSHASANSSSGVAGLNDGGGWGVSGVSNGFAGVFGFGSAGTSNGVFGLVNSSAGSGVFGKNSAGGTGILGQALGQDGSGVVGRYDGPASASGWGVFGYSTAGFAGVYGNSDHNGVLGQTASSSDAGIFGRNDASGNGVYGYSSAGYGANGFSATGYAGVYGNGGHNGIFGETSSASDAGVYAKNNAGGVGAFGQALGQDGTGVLGRYDGPSSGSGWGVFGYSPNGYAGVFGSGGHNGVFGATSSANDAAVYGSNNSSGTGVFGYSNGGAGALGITATAGQAAVAGFNTSSEANNGALGGSVVQSGQRAVFGVGGDAGPSDDVRSHYGVYGLARPGFFEDAGFFDGSVSITTDLFVAGSKNFKIDHPLDPANKYLIHSSVESSDRMNIYNGNIVTDGNGEATVSLPEWFEALNRDFRYHLTVIGQFAQAIVSAKVVNNRFAIKTDKPNIEVSWQITGVRQDAYARAHPMQVEREKTGPEKGTYTHPELYGLPPRTPQLIIPQKDVHLVPNQSEGKK